uniref:Uncharacterized protein n=1 Tax=Palpitomonas bilix TaxID=652834 RepID=A0A7S3G6N2_9EUKA|mmetsp:Transcript_34126/g.88076  ORF Transcript_34126/g.88076 Transcript_34126/m.88076 type:complete len:1316 (+) Transcript_34126:251-4198(+)
MSMAEGMASPPLRHSSGLGKVDEIAVEEKRASRKNMHETPTKGRVLSLRGRSLRHSDDGLGSVASNYQYPRKRSSYLASRRLSVSRVLAAIGVRKGSKPSLTSQEEDADSSDPSPVGAESKEERTFLGEVDKDSAFASDVHVKTKLLEDELTETVRRRRIHPTLLRFFDEKSEADFLLRREFAYVKNVRQEALVLLFVCGLSGFATAFDATNIHTHNMTSPEVLASSYLTGVTIVWLSLFLIVCGVGLATFSAPVLHWARLLEQDNVNPHSLAVAAVKRRVRPVFVLTCVMQVCVVVFWAAASLLSPSAYLVSGLTPMIPTSNMQSAAHMPGLTLLFALSGGGLDMSSIEHLSVAKAEVQAMWMCITNIVLATSFHRACAGRIWLPLACSLTVSLLTGLSLVLALPLSSTTQVVAAGVVVAAQTIIACAHGWKREKARRIDFLKQSYRDKAREHMLIRAEVEQEAKGKFLASVTHELRTPIHGVLGLLTLLGESKLSDEAGENVYLMKESMNGLLSLVNDILDASKLEAGQFTLAEGKICIRDKVETLVSVMEPFANRVGVDLLCYIDHQCPRDVIVDWKRFSQCITNLVSNAIKFSPRGKSVVVSVGMLPGMVVPVTPALDKSVPRRLLYADIEDEGIGIREEDLDRVFERFTQLADDNHGRIKGTGIGLSLVKQLSMLMGGDVTVSSIYGKGSSFRVTVAAGVVEGRVSVAGHDENKMKRVRRATIQMRAEDSKEVRDAKELDNDEKAESSVTSLATTESTVTSAPLVQITEFPTPPRPKGGGGKKTLKKRFTSPAFATETAGGSETMKTIKESGVEERRSEVRRPVLLVSDKKGMTKVLYKYCTDLGYEPLPCPPAEASERYARHLSRLAGTSTEEGKVPSPSILQHIIVDCAIGTKPLLAFLHQCVKDENYMLAVPASRWKGGLKKRGVQSNTERTADSDVLRSIEAAESILFGDGAEVEMEEAMASDMEVARRQTYLRRLLPAVCLVHERGWSVTRSREYEMDFSLIPQYRLTMLSKPIHLSSLKSFLSANDVNAVSANLPRSPNYTFEEVTDGVRTSFLGVTGLLPPRSAGSDVPPKSTSPTPSVGRVSHRRSSETVSALVVDDDALNRKFVSAVMRKAGYECDAAASGEEAMEKILGSIRYLSSRDKVEVVKDSQQCAPCLCGYDIIFMDWHLPEMSGLACTEALRKKGLSTPIVGITASSLESEKQTCIDSGMNEVLPKPFGSRELLPLVERLAKCREEERGGPEFDASPLLHPPLDGSPKVGKSEQGRAKEKYLAPLPRPDRRKGGGGKQGKSPPPARPDVYSPSD